MSRKISSIAVVSVLAVLSGCLRLGSEPDSPQKALSDYVSRSFAVKTVAEKAGLIELTSGEVREALESLDDAAFKHHFIDSKKEFVSMKIRDERKLAEDRHSITYELTYTNASQDSKDKVTNKKHAVILKANGKWAIDEVRNLKTFIEHQNEMSF